MKSAFLGLRTTIYKVSDIKKAKAWYSKVLGIQPYFDEVFYVGFNVGGYELGLQPEEKPSKTKEGGVTTYWGVDNVEEVFKQLLAHGATAYENPVNVGGEIVVATVKDPWGNLFGIIYNPEFRIEPKK
jgi:predicted enzyme related to lactoylglutathione lyase